MEFPLDDLFDDERSEQWVMNYVHPNGLPWTGGGRGTDAMRRVLCTRRSGVTVYRCRQCHRVDNVYTGTIQGNQRRLTQVILLVRDVCKGKPSTVLAKELGISRTTVHILQRAMQCIARQRQLDTPLDDQHTETDEIFRHAGKIKERTIPTRPTRRDGRPPGAGAQDRRVRPSVNGEHAGPEERTGTATGCSADQTRHPGSERRSLYLYTCGSQYR